MNRMMKSIKKVLLIIVTVTIFISSFQIFGDVYAVENNKIDDENTHGEYNKDIQEEATHQTQINKTDSDVIIKEPTIVEDTSRFDDEDELINERTENSKTYQLDSGKYVTEYYFQPVHKKEGEKYVEIDNTLEKQSSFFRSAQSSYSNKDGLYDFQVNNGYIEISDSNDQILTMIPEGNLKNFAVKENVILYSSILDNVDLEYRVESNYITQNIYINGQVNIDRYSFQLNGDHFIAEVNEEGNLVLKKDTEVIYTFLKPYLKDYNLVAYEETAKQHEHGELFHTLQQLKAGDQLLIIVGCEGGVDESEIQELNEMGVKCCSLGNRILRSETAPLYLMSVIGYSRELTK